MNTFEQTINGSQARPHEVIIWTAENSKRVEPTGQNKIARKQAQKDSELHTNALNEQARLLLINEMFYYRDSIINSSLLEHPDFPKYYDSASEVLNSKAEKDIIEEAGSEQKEYQIQQLDTAIKGYALLAFSEDQKKQGAHIKDEFIDKWEKAHDESGKDGFKSPQARLAFYEFRALVALYDPCRNPIEKEIVDAYLRADKFRKDIPLGKYILLHVLLVICGVRFNVHKKICNQYHHKKEKNVTPTLVDRKINRNVSHATHRAPYDPGDTFQTLAA